MPRLASVNSHAISKEEFNERRNSNNPMTKGESKKFISNLTQNFHIDFLTELNDKIKNTQVFLDSEIVGWINYTINHAYAERNLEVHNNIKNEISYTFLFDNLKRIISVIVNELIENIDTKNKTAKKLFEKINKKGDKIVSL